jgi:hypothetical protein
VRSALSDIADPKSHAGNDVKLSARARKYVMTSKRSRTGGQLCRLAETVADFALRPVGDVSVQNVAMASA